MEHLVHCFKAAADSQVDLKAKFLEAWITSTLTSLALNLLSDKLKLVVPSSKKKKKGADQGAAGPQQDVQAFIISPLKQLIKELSV